MKKWLLFFALALTAGAFLFQNATVGSGYVLISLGKTSIEMSFWAAVIGLLLIFTLLLLLWWLLGVIFGSVSGSVKILRGRSGKTAQQQTARGLVYFIEGNWKQARRMLIKSARKSEDPLINYLAAARSSYELGKEKEALTFLHKAGQVAPDSKLAVELTQARMLLVGKKYEQCLANLERAKSIAPDHPVVLDLLQQTYGHLGDWSALKKIFPELEVYSNFTEDKLEHLRHTLHLALLQQAGQKAVLQTPEVGRVMLKKEWDETPGHLRKKTDIVLCYVEQLMKLNAASEVESVIRRHLRKNWDDELVEYYGKVQSDDPKKQLVAAQGWLKERPGNATILLALGRLAFRNNQPEQAEEYLQSSLKLNKSAAVYAELGKLSAQQNNYQKATEYYQLSFAAPSLDAISLPADSDHQGNNNLSPAMASSSR